MNREYLEILRQYWGHDDFRGIQREVIGSVSMGRDTLALMPTGGGKSVCFQVPALASEGICVVISPLIALMNDQVRNLKSKGIKAELITSELHRKDIEIILGNCVHDSRIKFLYVSPERLKTEVFREAYKRMNVCLLAVDEAHCISQWGYDFRPAYLQIAEIRALRPGVPVLALTATATAAITKDICRKLEFPEENIIKMSFSRSNLGYVVLHSEEKLRKIQQLLDKIQGSAIIYAGTRRRVKELSDTLEKFGVGTTFYHAGLSIADKKAAEIAWKNGEKRVMVATNAFGMGIDKPDVRLVIHADVPSEPEAYFQEAGRAGRDGATAWAVLIWNQNDLRDLDQKLRVKYPTPEFISAVYQRVANHCQVAFGSGEGISGPLRLGELSTQTGRNATEIYAALKLLELAGYVSVPEHAETEGRIRILCDNKQLYDFRLRHKEYETLITLMLRLLEGVFEQYCSFNEEFAQKRLKVSAAELRRKLDFLHQNRIIDYHPPTKEPRVTFERMRPVGDRIELPASVYRDRRKIDMLRVNAMRAYLMGQRCRSVSLLDYFGEKNAPHCGTCDHCRKAKQLNMSPEELEALAREADRLVRTETLTPEGLLSRFALKAHETLLQLSRWKLDAGMWQSLPDGTLSPTITRGHSETE